MAIDRIDYLLTGTASGVNPTTLKRIVFSTTAAFIGQTQVATFTYSGTAVSSVAAGQQWYVVDGTNLFKITAAGAASTISTGGAGQPPTGARLATLYRNRLVLGRTTGDPQNWFMSAVNSYEDFDYTDQDAGVNVAVAGNNSTAGKVGDVITCLGAINDDFLLMGCSDSVWLMRGDPAAGGRIDNVAWGSGIVGPDAWARDAAGRVYFLSRTDLWVMAPGGQPQSISNGRLQDFFDDLDFTTTAVRMVWDAVHKGLWIFFTSSTPESDVHLFWDQRLDAFTLHTLPITITATANLAGIQATDRQILIGGDDDLLYCFDSGAENDADGETSEAISAYVDFPPLALGEPGQRGMMTEEELVLAVQTYPWLAGCTMAWRAGDSPQEAIRSTTTLFSATTTTTGRWMHRGRLRGNTAVLRLSNPSGKLFSFESGQVLVTPAAGRTR